VHKYDFDGRESSGDKTKEIQNLEEIIKVGVL